MVGRGAHETDRKTANGTLRSDCRHARGDVVHGWQGSGVRQARIAQEDLAVAIAAGALSSRGFRRLTWMIDPARHGEVHQGAGAAIHVYLVEDETVSARALIFSTLFIKAPATSSTCSGVR